MAPVRFVGVDVQPTIFDQPQVNAYAGEMRKRRIQTVAQVLEEVPTTRKDHKLLVIEVWLRELEGKCFCPMHIKFLCSSPTGIDRDRRRPGMLAKYPRNDSDYEKFVDYKSEFSQ